MALEAQHGIETAMRTLKRPALIWLAALIGFGLLLGSAVIWSL